MTINDLDIDAYLDRIDYRGKTTPDFETLAALHTAHTLTVPFENLSVYAKIPIDLSPAALFNKIVTGKRGGYCFEMNGLFSAVLEQLGFKVTPLLARVAVNFERKFGAKTHQVLMVDVSGKRFLADVGFGKDGIIAPLCIESRDKQPQFCRTYRISEDPDFGFILDLETPEKTFCQYAFTLERCYPADFVLANHYTATHPDSPFVKGRFCTRPTPGGRITLTEQIFKTVTCKKTLTIAVKNEQDFESKLLRFFDLPLPRS